MESNLVWYDIRDFGIEGKGWNDTLRFYDRLPARAEAVVPRAVWDLSRSAIGMSAAFETDAPEIHARWQLLSPQLGEPNFPAAGFSGLDLYGDDRGALRWIAAGHLVSSQEPQQCLITGMEPQRRAYRLYLPLRNPVERVEVGVPAGCRLAAIPPRPKPVVFYGTSIVHGAYASRPGMVHPSILGRRLDRATVNLGFSGNAKMEPAVAELLAELDASLFVVDALPNMDLALVQERAEAFLTILRRRRPEVPVVLVEDRPLTNAWVRPAVWRDHQAKWSALRAVYDRLGDGRIHYVEGEALFGTDSEASPDSSHPTDLGFWRMADALEPIIRRSLA